MMSSHYQYYCLIGAAVVIVDVVAFVVVVAFAAPLSSRLSLKQNDPHGDIYTHEFFEKFDWEALRNQTMPPPYKPDVPTPVPRSPSRPTGTSTLLESTAFARWSEEGFGIHGRFTGDQSIFETF